MKQLIMNNHLRHILVEMFRRADRKFDEKTVKKPGWFSESSWNQAEEDDFKRWLIDYLHNNKSARQELMRYPRIKYKNISQFADQFVAFQGWKIIN